MMRERKSWMALSVREIAMLPDDAWEDYVSGACLCSALDAGECACGAWWRDEEVGR